MSDNYQRDSDETGSEGQGGKIHFRYKDALTGALRDDLLSPAEIKRLMTIHKELHKERVDKQKILRKERKAFKESQNKIASTSYQKGGQYTSGGYSNYKKHPISNKAQFSGIDKQVTAIPTENQADTNDLEKNELQNRNELRLRNQPKFNPRPKGPY